MLFADVFHTEIVYAKRKEDGAPSVRPETRSEFTLVAAFFVEGFPGELLGADACVRQPIHSAADIDVDVAVFGDLVGEGVLLGNIFREIAELKAHVFIAAHRSVQIEILNVDHHEPYAGCEDAAVNEELDGEEIDGGGSAVAGVV